jgi:hypothetical protein
VSLLPSLSGAFLPAPSVQTLTDDEQRLVAGLSAKLSMQAVYALVRQSYYDGTQRLANLGISIPPQLAGIRTVVDWPRQCIDPLVMRCVIDGFRLPGETDVDEELTTHWHANDLDFEAPLCFLDSLVTGRGYMIVGSPDIGDSPLVTVESPLNLAMTWDPRTRMPTAALQSYETEGVYVAVLYLPDQTIRMSREQNGVWAVDARDMHRFGEVPVVRFTNRSRSADREGCSEITPAVMNTTDSACRTLLGMEIAREFYSVPHRYVLGATESDFQDAEGNPKTALDMAMNKFLALERDEDGNVPTIGQFQAFDPSVFTKIIDKHAQLMASYTGFPPSYFGQTADANPASADAIRVAHDGMDRRGRQVQAQFTTPTRRVQQLVWRFAHQGAELPEPMRQLAVDWADVATPTPAATTDALFKQAQMGAVTPTSDVVRKRMGYSAVERRLLDQDARVDAGAQVLAELANSEIVRHTRANATVANALKQTSDDNNPS